MGSSPTRPTTVAQLLDQYVSTAGWDVSTRESNLGYIRRIIQPAIGSAQVRKVRGPLLDTLYARLMRCGNLACTGRPFTEHRNIPDLRPDPADPRFEWEQAADRVRAAIRSGQLTSGGTLPSVPDLARLQGLKPGTVRHAFLALAEEGLVRIRHGRTTTIAGEQAADEPGPRRQVARPRAGHDCTLSGCRPHVCKPMAKGTIRGIHAILSGAFEAAMRWDWTDRNPVASARPPIPSRQTILATSPDDVAKVIAEARARNTAARLGHSGGGATTLRHYADPVPEVDRRAAAYLAQLTAGSSAQNGQGQA